MLGPRSILKNVVNSNSLKFEDASQESKNILRERSTGKRSNRSNQRSNSNARGRSYSPEFTHGIPDESIERQLRKLTGSATGPSSKVLNFEEISKRANVEMINLLEMKSRLQTDFDFKYL